jgi:hypothetical protein
LGDHYWYAQGFLGTVFFLPLLLLDPFPSRKGRNNKQEQYYSLYHDDYKRPAVININTQTHILVCFSPTYSPRTAFSVLPPSRGFGTVALCPRRCEGSRVRFSETPMSMSSPVHVHILTRPYPHTCGLVLWSPLGWPTADLMSCRAAWSQQIFGHLPEHEKDVVSYIDVGDTTCCIRQAQLEIELPC